MREQTFQRLLKPHSFPLSWRDKKGAPGGIPSPRPLQGFCQILSGLSGEPFLHISKNLAAIWGCA